MNRLRKGPILIRGETGDPPEFLPANRSRRRSTGIATGMAFLLLSAVFATSATGSDVLRETLANGLRVVIVRNTLAPVVTTEINYRVGSNEAPEGFPGTAHALEHMMFRGSRGLSADQLSAIMAALGGDFNADTQQTVTQYYLTVPPEDLEVALHIESIRMRNVLATEALWEKERGAIEQEVAQDLSNPEYLFFQQLLRNMFPGTPYAEDALGTRPSFQKTTGAMLRKFHEEWYAPNNAVLVIAGDVDPGRALSIVKRLFGSIPSRPLPARPEIRLAPLEPATIALDTDLPYGLAVVAYRMPGYDSPDYAAGQVLQDVLDSRRGRLYALVPEGKALSVDFDGDVLPKTATGFATAAFPGDADGRALISEMKRILSGYAEKGVPAGLVEAAKRHEIADAEFRKNSVAGLASAWSQALAVEGRNSPDDDIEAIRGVTVGDVNRVAREFLVNETAVVAVLTPKPSGKPVSRKGFGGGESFTPEVVGPVALPAWAKNVRGLPPIPKSRVNPAVVTLPNGLRLIVQTVSISKTVTVFGHVKNSPALQEPEGKEGIAKVLDALFPYGTTTLDRLAFQEALDEIGAEESAGTSFSLRVLSDRFDKGVGLLAENLLHPAMPEKGFAVVRKEIADEVAGELTSPGYLARRALRSSLYPAGDPALRQASPATVESLSLADVKAYYDATFRPDLTTVVVIGAVSPARAKEVFEKWFGGWNASGPAPETDLPRVPENKPSASAVPDASRVQDEVTLAQTLGITTLHPDRYALQVGRNVLSGAFYATRLSRDLRERAGLVYTVDSVLDVGRTRSLFAVFYACDPQKVSKVRGIVERDLRAMREKPVTDAELLQAQMFLIRQIPLSESSVDAIAHGLIERREEGLPLDEPVRAARSYREMTARRVREAFARWIRPNDLVQVTRGPEPE
jgi:zinc protease